MSKQVDQRVVEMKFDNQEFERRVSGTMSTLDKLKQKLNFSGAAKGLEGIGKSAKNVDMRGLASGVDTVRARFSALDVVGVTALANITNAAMNAGKRIVASLTIDPVKTGFQEYETQINAVQTIMANVGHKGKTLKDVNKALEELNKYADMTIYNFTEMTRNIGLFTNAGVDLDTSVAAIKGFSNAAAMAGTDATRTAAAMYQLSQAMSSGKVMLRDWMSLEQANITGERFRETLKITARAHGIAIDEMIANEGNLRDTLKDGWLTADLMAEALNHYTLSREAMGEAEQEAARQMMLANGYTEEQIEQLFDLGTEATNAATVVKTFTQMLGVLAETAQSGWAKTWQIIFGDFEEAKGLFKPLSDFFQNIIEKISKARNDFLDSALSKNFRHLIDGINDVTKSLKKGIQPLQDYAKVVDDIISGKWGNAPTRWQELTKAGYDWAHAQNLVNEKLGNSLRRQTSYTETQTEAADATVEMTEATVDQIIALTKLSDAELRAKNYNDEQIKSLRELVRVAKQLGIPLKEFIEKLDEIDGRWLLLKGFENIGKSLVTIFTATKDAWKEVMGTLSPDKLFNVIAAFHKLSRKLVVSDETADKLKRTMKGVFAILDAVVTLISVPFKVAGKILLGVLKAIDLIPHDILGVTAVIGDAIVGFRDWLDSIIDIDAIVKFLVPHLKKAKDATVDWFKGLKDVEIIQKVIKYLKQAKNAVVDWFNEIKNQKDIGKYIMDGLKNGVGDNVKTVINFIKEVGIKILDAIKDVLGIESPSKEFYEIGKNSMQGLYNGIKDFVKMVYNLIASIGKKIIEIVKGLDLGSIITIALGGGMVFGLIKFAQAIDRLTQPLEHLDDIMFQAAKVVKKFGGVLSGVKWFLYSKALQSLAISIAILAGSVALLSLLDQKKVWSAVGAVTVLMVVLGALTAVAGHFGKNVKGLELGKVALSLLAVAVAMGIMALALRTISKLDTNNAFFTIAAFAGIVGAMVLLVKALGKSGQDMAKLGGTLLGLGAAFLLIAMAVKVLGKMDEGALKQGLGAIAAFAGIVAVLMLITQFLGMFNVDVIGKAISKIAWAMLLMMIVIKIAGGMDVGKLAKGLTVITAFAGIIVGLMAATQLVGMWNVDSIGKTILGIATAMLLMSLVISIVGGMDGGKLAKGIGITVVLGGIVVGLIAATRLATDKDLAKVASTILAISVAIGILAVIAALLSLIDVKNLAKGVIAVGLIAAMVAGLIYVTKYAEEFKGTMIAITVALGVLALAVALLSIIDPERLIAPTLALSMLMGMLALVIKSTGSAKQAIGTLITVGLTITLLAAILTMVAKLPADRTLAGAIALSLLLGMMSATMYIMSKMSSISPKALLGLVGLVAVCGLLYIIVDVLRRLGNVEDAAKNALALSKFMSTLSKVLLMTAIVGAIYTMTSGIAATGLLGMAALMATLYIVVDVLRRMSSIENAVENMNALTTFLKEMTKVLTVLALIGPLLLIATVAVAGLTALMGAMVGMVTSVGALMTAFPNLEKFLDKGIPVMVKLAGGIGEMLGAFLGNIMTGITSGLPKMAMDLSMFMANLIPFITGAKLIDSKMLSGVSSLAKAVMLITGADLLQRITSIFGGDNSIESFGKQLGSLGTSMNKFAENLGTFDESKVTSIDCAARAIKTLAEAAKTIPGTDGLWQSLAGEKSLAAFGKNLPNLAKYLCEFVVNLGTFTDAQVTTVDCAGKAIKTLASAASEIPRQDGLWQLLAGDKSLATFGGQLPGLGENLSGFVSKLGTFTDAQVTTTECAGEAIVALANAASNLPRQDGLWQLLAGDKSLATFGGQLPKLAENLVGFVSGLGTFTADQITTVKLACDAIGTIAKLGEIDIADTGEGLNTFGKNMVKFAKKVKDFLSHISEVSSAGINDAIYKTTQLIDMAKTISDTNINSLSNFGKSLKSVAKDGVNGFVKELKAQKPKDNARAAMKTLLNEAIKAVENKTKDVTKAFTTLAEKAVAAIDSKDNKDAAWTSGENLVKGFAKGIKDNEYRATDAGTSLGKAALEAAKEALDENSPSKEAMKIGNFFGQGLVIGIKDYASRTYDAGYDVADRAKAGLSKAISRISAILSDDMDAQPVITPVLDLSDVEAGANSLSGMFNNPSVGVTSNINAISAGVNARNQNGVNGDVVNAINKLRKGIDSMPKGDTYNVNGITYDDGSNIRDAVETIIRAALVERRS